MRLALPKIPVNALPGPPCLQVLEDQAEGTGRAVPCEEVKKRRRLNKVVEDSPSKSGQKVRLHDREGAWLHEGVREGKPTTAMAT